MKFGAKKILSGVLAGIIAMSLCGCADNGYIMKVDGMDIRNGIYIYYQQNAYSTACDKLNEIYGSSSSSSSGSSSSSSSSSTSSPAQSSSSSMDFFTQSIENKSSSDWVKQETLRLVRQFVAVQRIAAEKNLTLTNEDNQEISDVLKEMWDTENYIYQLYYGFNTLGEYYESKGISRETMKMLYEVNSLKSKVFMSMYDKDGEKAIPDEEFFAQVKKSYASARILKIAYNDEHGKATTDSTRIDKLKALAQSYADKLNDKKSFVDVKYECELAAKQEIAKADAEEAYKKEPVEGKTLEEYVKEEVDKVSVEKIKEEDADTVFEKEGSYSYDEAVFKYITNAEVFDKAVTMPSEEDKCVYVILCTDITKNTHWQEENRENVLVEIKGDEFEGYLDIYSQNYSVEKNSYLVDTKYSPEKLFKQTN